jgi:hypothetical protein
MLDILAGTPFWVYPLFLVVLWMGYTASRRRARSRLALIRLPSIFVVWSILNIWLNARHLGPSVASWAGGVVVGASIGVALFRSARLARHADPDLVVVPGTWLTLGLVVAIFAMNYVFGYLRATSPGLLASNAAALLVTGLSGVSGGIFIGQAGVYLRQAARLRTEER